MSTMLKAIATTALLCFWAFAAAGAPLRPECAANLPLGAPTVAGEADTTTVCHPGYVATVDEQRLVPLWVAYVLTREHTLGCMVRTNNFHADDGLPKDHRAAPADYVGSGYDMGHQAPFDDFAYDDALGRDSFSLANMAPQLPGLNRQGWERLEDMVRAWAWQRGELAVFVGPVLGSPAKTIGAHKIIVPVAFWKVLVDLKTGEAIGFLMPQANVAKGDARKYEVPVALIEGKAGVHLPLPASVDRTEKPSWPADVSGWQKAKKAGCAR